MSKAYQEIFCPSGVSPWFFYYLYAIYLLGGYEYIGFGLKVGIKAYVGIKHSNQRFRDNWKNESMLPNPTIIHCSHSEEAT